jgi:hypothetical protein
MADECETDNPSIEAEAVVPIRFESTIAQMVSRVYRVDPLDHTRDQMIHVMDGVRDALDARERMKRTGWHGVGDDSYANRKARIVEYLRDGGFLSDLHEDDDLSRLRVQMSWDETVTTLAKKSNASKPSRVWLMDQLDWFRLETAVDSGEPPGRGLARELDISPTSLNTLFGMYDSAGRCRSGA